MSVPEPGDVLAHYRLVEKIGEGGMGVVWKALDTRLDRHVALKLLRPELTADPERYRRFLREARTAAAVTHPNIVTIHEVDEAAGTTFLCMELVEGRTLRAAISGRPLAIPEALRIAAEVADGLARAHRDGIIHRDLKPENVILDVDGNAKILDFGLAKLVESRRQSLSATLSEEETRSVELTGTGVILGTAAYMSPEQARGEAVDARSDLFSFGILLYEMVTGRRPFQGSGPIATLAAVLHDEAAPASQQTAAVPPRLDEILRKCLEKSPDRRYQTSQDLASDLRRLQRDLDAGVAQPAGKAGSKAKAHRRSRLIVLLIAAVALAGGGSLLASWLGRQAAAPPAPAHARTAIAVLPFGNLSTDGSQAYFAAGLHDELLTQLTKVAALKVISRTSVMNYQGTAKPLRAIAAELGVGSVVEGSVQVIGDRLRVHVQLIDAATDSHLWAERYDRALDDAFAIQSEMAQRIVAAVGAALTSAEQAGLTAPSAIPPQAYQLYLQGRVHVGRQLEAEILQGIRCLEQAVDLAPDYAAAYASLAGAYLSLTVYGRYFPSDTYPKAREFAAKALALDPASAEARLALGRLNFADWDWKSAEENLMMGLAAGGGANQSLFRDNFAFVLLYCGRLAEAISQMQQAVELDPLNINLRQNLGEVLYYARRFDESIAASREAIKMDPLHPQTHLFLGLALAAMGENEEAVRAFDRDAIISNGQRPEVDSWLPMAYALAGQTERSRQLYADMLSRPHDKFTSPFPLACTCFLLGDRDHGFEWLEQGYAQRDHRMSYLKVHPACDGIRSDPRYLHWLEAMGLDP